MNTPRDWEVLLVADFTADGLAGMLRQPAPGPRIRTTVTGVAQAIPTLLQPPDSPTGAGWDAVVVWVRPSTALPSLAGPFPDPEAPTRLAGEVSGWAAILKGLAHRVSRVLVAGWSPEPGWLDRGVLGAGGRLAAPVLLQEAQARLARELADAPNIILLDATPWLAAAGDQAHVPSLWYLAKIPFGPLVLRAAASTLRSQLRRMAGPGPVKLLIVDLDDTLWGGTLGEVGWEKLRIGGHDAIGEAFADFQRGLKALVRRGVLLAIASRNDETNALDALQRHPEMVLRPDDFAGWRINWDDKAASIGSLLAELNLGPQSAAFLDNDPAQRERIRGAFPDLLVPDWPEDPILYPEALATLDAFDPGPDTDEDRARSALYAQRRAAESGRAEFGGLDEWIASLKTEITFEALHPGNRVRALQLLNKTNQMNLSTRRLTDPELDAWLAQPGREFWTLRVRDRFGDAGLTGLVSLAAGPDAVQIVDFVLSCRVMGRGIEDAMAAWATERARGLGHSRVVATHLPTERNGPCLRFWRERSGFIALPDSGTFTHTLPPPRTRPAGLRITVDPEPAA